MKYRIVAITALAAALAGCGGGGSKNREIDTRVVQPIQGNKENETSHQRFRVVATGYGLQSSGQSTTTKNVETALLNLNSGETPGLGVVSADKDFKFNAIALTRRSKDDSSTRFLMSDASANSPNAPTTFGIVNNDKIPDTLKASAYYGGKEVTNLPASGTATYAGKYADVARKGAGQINRNGDFSLQADFNAGSVNGRVIGLRDTDNVAAGDIAFKAGMDQSRAAYSTSNGGGNFVSFNGKNSAAAAAEGRFFNDNASETAGIIRDATHGSEVIGAFYGARQ